MEGRLESYVRKVRWKGRLERWVGRQRETEGDCGRLRETEGDRGRQRETKGEVWGASKFLEKSGVEKLIHFSI